jgi:hypothetical protein
VFVFAFCRSNCNKSALTQIDGQNIEGSELKAEFLMEQNRQSRSGVTRNNRNSFRSSNISGNVSSPLRPTDFPLRYSIYKLISNFLLNLLFYSTEYLC